ncbi:MAG: aminotransferase class I/II-fold pyridoxal phosphate-dependent enzyme [Bariatricus sp.]|nr:aminotransferase class I/II-fold pyridoxal phosphate-dependent enzyme [Bariatricus sp.]
MKRLYDRLEEYSRQDYYGFHMPGHKRNTELVDAKFPYEIDITEIEGFDDLHHAGGILKEAQERAARVFGADETHFLVNGSTVGILSAILGSTRKGDKILVARHCHKSIHHAIYMNELVPRYLYPAFDEEMYWNGEIRAEDVRTALEAEPDIRAVVIVSPNYDGVVSDVRGIARAAHEKGIPLIVDEAHGAHFGFHAYFPERSNDLEADIVIQSLHKTLPSLTQTALLHINGEIADRKKIRKYLDMLQSSSPSYVFMASLDACVDFVDSEEGKNAFDIYAQRLKEIREKLQMMQHLKLLEAGRYDPSKIVISVVNTNMTSHELYEKLLNDYHLQMEMVAGTYLIAMTSVADTKEGLDRLSQALLEIDRELESGEEPLEISGELPRLVQVETPFSIAEKQEQDMGESILWKQSEGRISMEYAYLYPPGSPVIVPGERISREAVELLSFYEQQKFQIEGIQEKGRIKVLRNE